MSTSTSLWTAVAAATLKDIEASGWRHWPAGAALQALANEAYVWLHEPQMSLGTSEVWRDLELDDRPGMIAIGGDGRRELLAVDGRDPRSAVTLTCIVSQGWPDSVVQASSVEDFVAAVEDGTFELVFED